jgi:tetratricopeptide (TPR) repeat protein
MMSLEKWLDLIRDRFSPEEGQILLRSLQQDPLVWQFVQDEPTSLVYFESAPNDLNAYAPGKMAVWLVEQSTGISLSDLGQGDFSLPQTLKARGAQTFETTFNTGLPPADLYTAGLLAIILHERRIMKKSWDGISKELFTHRNQLDDQKNFRVWQTPLACLFSLCSDFDDMADDFLRSSESTAKAFIPIYINTLLANPMAPSQRMAQMFATIKTLSTDLQLESLKWLENFNHGESRTQLARHLMQIKDNRDFFARVFTDLEAFEAVNPEIDPLQKHVRFSLPEDVNRIAAFHHFSGNPQRADETYQKSSDLLEFLKSQTLFQTLAGDSDHVSPSRWLEIIKSVPHSKQARLFYVRSLIEEQEYTEALKQLEDLPQSIEKQFLQGQFNELDKPTIHSLIKSTLAAHNGFDELPHHPKSYFVHQAKINPHSAIINLINRFEDLEISLDWLERYLQTNIHDTQAIKLARERYEKANQIDKAIQWSAFLERLEPSIISHKRDLARLYAHGERWEKAYILLKNLVKSESSPEITDLERFAEAALRTGQVDVAMSICQNILNHESHNTKALVLLGECFMQNGDVLKAIQHMESVVTMIPEEPETWMTLAWLWNENDQFDRALETLIKGAERAPNQPKLLRALGGAYLQQEAPSEALPALKLAYDLEPNQIEGKLNLARAHLGLGQPQHAYQLLETYIKNYQQYPQAARLLGHILMTIDKIEQAEPVLLYAASYYPEDIETVLTASRLVIDRVESDPNFEAVQEILENVAETLQKSTAAHPENDQIALHLADIDRLNGDHQKAFDAYSHLAQTGDSEQLTQDWRLKYGLGQAAVGLGNHDVGLAALQTALNLQPSNLMVRHALADAYQVADLSGKANAMAKSALKLAPQDLKNILWYAKFNTRNNEPDEAVRALKEALQITPQKDELKLWLAKSLVSAGSLEDAHEKVREFISSGDRNPKLLHQAAYVAIHLNDLTLAEESFQKALLETSGFNPTLLMDLSVTYALMEDHKKALDTLNIDQALVVENPEIALLTADLLSNLGQYEHAQKTLDVIKVSAERVLDKNSEENEQKNSSPLLYTHDLTLKGYHFRQGLLARTMGMFAKAQEHFSAALNLDPLDTKLRNACVETEMIDLKFLPALKMTEQLEPYGLLHGQASQELLDLFCSQLETLLYLNEIDKATTLFNQLSQVGGNYPRYLAIQSRFATQHGEIELAIEYLNQARKLYQKYLGDLTSQALPVIFRQIINLHSIGEASLALADHREAIQTWKQVTDAFNSQPLFNWRYLHALVTGAEVQQVAEAVHITHHCPGKTCHSQENYKTAEFLLESLHKTIPQEQIVCMKARIVSAFTGKWPLHLNVDACLQGAEEAAAVLIGSQDERLVKDILESYPEDNLVLQAYGIYALRHNKNNAAPFVEKALRADTSNPVNHALLAYVNIDQPELALKSIDTALSFWPEESEWHALAADLNTYLGNTSAASEHIKLALENQPTNAAFWQKSAMLKVAANELEQAKSDLEKSTAYQPDDPKTWVKMAEINHRMGDDSEAINNIRKASKLDPDDLHLVEKEMQFLFAQKHFTDLEIKAKELLTKDSTNETAVIFLAQALANQGKFEQALSTLQAAISKTKSHPRLALEHIKIKKAQMGVEAVLPELVSFAQDHSEDPQILATLTDWLIQSNRLDEAEEVAQTTLRILPEQAQVYLMLGRLQRMRGKLDQAIAHLSEAITLEPTLVDAYIELGKTYQERRDLEKAIETYQKGSKANKSDPRPYFHAGLALKDCKDYLGAEVMLKEAKKYSPDDANIIRQLGVVTALNLINNLREAK